MAIAWLSITAKRQSFDLQLTVHICFIKESISASGNYPFGHSVNTSLTLICQAPVSILRSGSVIWYPRARSINNRTFALPQYLVPSLALANHSYVLLLPISPPRQPHPLYCNVNLHKQWCFPLLDWYVWQRLYTLLYTTWGLVYKIYKSTDNHADVLTKSLPVSYPHSLNTCSQWSHRHQPP